VVAELWEAYDVARFKEGALDFDDLLLSTHALLTKDKEVLSKLQHRWTHLLIDEYQDTNRVQYEIARLLAGANKNLTVVGDIDQNIYSWRGADIGHLLSFEKTFPGATVVMLEQNYRSTRTIVGAANGVIARNKNRYDKTLFTENDGGEQIDLYYATGESDEAMFVAKTAREYMQKGTPAHEIAVLYRANFQSRALEEAFIKMGVPYRLLGTKFFERSEVKDVLSYLRAALNPQSSGDIARIVASPPRGIGKTTLAKVLEGAIDTLPATSRNKVEVFFSLLARIAECAKTQPVSHTIKFIIRESGLETHLTQGSEEDKERLLNAKELVNLATKYDALEPLAAAEKLLEEAALMTDQDSLMNVEENNAVSLMTVHASKGLEFDVVFITGLEEGLFPYESDDDDRDQEEERRLFYVALTRARKKVYLTSAATRMMFGNRELCTPSQFLSDIEPAYLRAAFGGTTAPEKPRRSFDEFGYEEDTIY
jgi:DNA helicase-2/ATP-dependent DNA helicase PcrA